MNNTRTVFCRNIIRIKEPERAFFALLSALFFASRRVREARKIREERLIGAADEIRALSSIDNLVIFSFFVVRSKAALGQDVIIKRTLVENLHIVDFAAHTQAQIARQCPRRCRPSEEIRLAVRKILVAQRVRARQCLETNRNSRVLLLFVALRQLVS